MGYSLSEMIADLEALLEALSKKNGGSKAFVPVERGTCVGQTGRYWLYRFVVRKVTIPDDTPVEVHFDGQAPLRGVVASHLGGKLVVGLEKDLGPLIGAAMLVVDLTWLLERLRDRLDDVRRGTDPFNRASAERTFRPARARVADRQPHPVVERGPRVMNEDQLQAVRRSLGSDTTFVWGPPGTGKTWTLARVVEAHFRAGRSVLLVSNTNVAVDVALEEVAERLRDEPEFDRGLVLRHGPIAEESLRRSFGEQVSPERVAVRLRKERQPEARREAQRHRQEAEKARAERRRLEADWMTWVMSTPARWSLNETISRAERSAEEADRAAPAAAGNIRELESEIAELLARCRILATTVHRTYGYGGNAPRHFDTVVVDEASTLMPPLVYWAAGLAARSVTVAGDFRQLPPVVAATPAAPSTLKRDVFEVAGIPHRLKQPPAYLVSLGTQYRMREPICEAVNRHFYPERPLRSHPSVRHSGTGFPFSEAALLYVDTAPLHPWASRSRFHPADRSHYNPCHALLVRNVVRHLVDTGYLSVGEDVPAEEIDVAVGVISPYRAQVRWIEKLLVDPPGPGRRGIAFTIHGSQGKEWKTTVIDLTDSDGIQLGHFLQATQLAEVGARMLNVALSRAKHHSMLIGNFAYLRRKAPAHGFVPRVLDHFEQHGTRLIFDGVGGPIGGGGPNRSDDDALGHAGNDRRAVRVDGLVPSEREWLKRSCPRSSCDGRLVVRHGPKGHFLACTNFLEARKCSHTVSLDPSATAFGVTP